MLIYIKDAPILMECITTAAPLLAEVVISLGSSPLNKFERRCFLMFSYLHDNSIAIKPMPVSEIYGFCLLTFGEDHERSTFRPVRSPTDPITLTRAHLRAPAVIAAVKTSNSALLIIGVAPYRPAR